MVRRTFIKAALVILVLVVLVVGLGLPLDNTLGRLAAAIGRPVMQLAGNAVRVFDADDGRTELGREIVRLRLQLVEAERLRRENGQLRRELDFAGDSDLELIAADIINYQPDPLRVLLRINAGREDGIAPGAPVLAEGVLAGVVTAINDRDAEVRLAGDSDFRALVETAGGTATGALRGQIGGGQVMEQIPLNAEIEPGDLVVTSGLDGTFRRGLLVGTVTAVTEAPGDLFKTAQVSSGIDIRELTAVMVVKP